MNGRPINSSAVSCCSRKLQQIFICEICLFALILTTEHVQSNNGINIANLIDVLDINCISASSLFLINSFLVATGCNNQIANSYFSSNTAMCNRSPFSYYSTDDYAYSKQLSKYLVH